MSSAEQSVPSTAAHQLALNQPGINQTKSDPAKPFLITCTIIAHHRSYNYYTYSTPELDSYIIRYPGYDNPGINFL